MPFLQKKPKEASESRSPFNFQMAAGAKAITRLTFTMPEQRNIPSISWTRVVIARRGKPAEGRALP
jgi:hypothetical protein